jgi:import inner membrane translocase subunit TIM44
MNSFVQSSRSITPNALNRTATRAAHARSPAYRRLSSDALSSLSRQPATSRTLPALSPAALRSPFLPHDVRPIFAPTQTRSLHQSTTRWQEDKAKKTEAKEEAAEKKVEEEGEKKSEEGEKKSEEGEKKSEDGAKKEKAEDMPPPPPHGDKTPWQVFMDTMQTELKASKEWNESTKALSGEVKTFQESERVRKAREAYESTTGAIGKTTSTVVKTTAGAIGKGAAWTWDTSAMKGVRKVANVTGDALDKATKPIRETEAFKNVKDVIDDGSSSRYGGWVEKEERRKKREAAKASGQVQQVMEEDPE